jgi:hypothetical protein
MVLSDKILNKLFNSEYIKNIYPMIDNIDVNVDWDGDDAFPFYKLHVTVKLNDPSFNEYNIYEKGFDPHYLYDYHLKYLLNFLNINLNTALIEQVFIKVLNPNGEEIVKY